MIGLILAISLVVIFGFIYSIMCQDSKRFERENNVRYIGDYIGRNSLKCFKGKLDWLTK